VNDYKSGAPGKNAAMEAKSSRYETAKLEAQERERRMALLLISLQDSKAIINGDSYFFLLDFKVRTAKHREMNGAKRNE